MLQLYKIFIPKKLPLLRKILYSGNLSYGQWGQLFEKTVSEYLGNKFFVSLNSYNSAILVAIKSLNLKPGDEIIISPISCLASVQPYISSNIKLVWADIDPKIGTLDPDSVRKKISKKTKAIVHYHFCGYVGYINEIQDIARKYGLYYIDDAIEAFGSNYKGKLLGNCNSDITIFSFNTVRVPNTIEGGGLTFNNKVLFEKALLIRDLGIKREIFRDKYGEISKKCDITLQGYAATMNELFSYIGFEQMKFVPSLIQKQRKNAKRLEKLLIKSKFKVEPIKPLELSIPNYWIYGILSENKLKTIISFRNKGIYASGIHTNVSNYSIFNHKASLKGVKEFDLKFVALPSGWWVKNYNNLSEDI